MATDLSKLAKQMASKHPTQNGLGDLLGTYYRQERDIQKALLGTRDRVPSLIEEFHRQQEQSLRDYHKLFSSPAQQALKALIGHQRRDAQRIDEAIGDQLHDAAEINRQFLEQLSYKIEPVQEILARLKSDYAIAAPWWDQVKGAADHAAALLDTLSDESSTEEDGPDWIELDKQLSDFDASIQQLPRGDSTEGQGRASGLSLDQYVALVGLLLSLFGVLLGILALIDTRAQGRLAAQQHATEAARLARTGAEDRAYRDRLISAIDALAQRIPTQQLSYVVGPRSATIRSQPGAGCILGRVHPNQVVTVTEHEGRWMKLTYRDHLGERDVEGWVLKHYLVRLP